MARYGKEHKEATRQRIVESASRRFKQSGVDGSGIATLMADVGLTNGAFYAHFESKDDLVATIVTDEVRAQADAISALPAGKAGLEQFIREYLSVEHRDNAALGCPSAALLDEIVRCGDAAREGYTAGAATIIDEIAARLSPRNPSGARGRAIGLFTLLVGSLQLSRALTDGDLSLEVLERGIENAGTFFR
ncbi:MULTISPECIES: TetR/AcrR family transcriptional regulator [unclassified Nocardioides]|uniref:TetR/AcrR family transcriptional regulator n=1 Tax=unclassified Nocardioides TaxID=2615069 RepID=UPI0006F4FEC6|nr:MULTISPECIES: TetR/AcrR family transcriptional regulator [unclassified Nocardioides]KRA37813.1 TetR family transcriptional regulator [Nocardioides sp. Root614]KRA91773.1 TetR family transcriptional regulator [Nocardioides sp. Root682]